MLILKLKGKELFQRFFLDAGIGFWEEYNKEDTFYDLSDLPMLDLANELEISGKQVTSIECNGSVDSCSKLVFTFEQISILVKFSNEKDVESDILLLKL